MQPVLNLTIQISSTRESLQSVGVMGHHTHTHTPPHTGTSALCAFKFIAICHLYISHLVLSYVHTSALRRYALPEAIYANETCGTSIELQCMIRSANAYGVFQVPASGDNGTLGPSGGRNKMHPLFCQIFMYRYAYIYAHVYTCTCTYINEIHT